MKEEAPTPRRRNAARSKSRIIAAAQTLFAAKGYASTGLREIADHAGVSHSLVVQHFGSKAELFEATLTNATRTDQVFGNAPSTIGRALVEQMLTGEGQELPAMVMLSIGDPDARAIARRVLEERAIGGMAALLSPRDSSERALEFLMLATGFVMYARHLQLGPVTERTKAKFASLLQSIIEET